MDILNDLIRSDHFMCLSYSTDSQTNSPQYEWLYIPHSIVRQCIKTEIMKTIIHPDRVFNLYLR